MAAKEPGARRRSGAGRLTGPGPPQAAHCGRRGGGLLPLRPWRSGAGAGAEPPARLGCQAGSADRDRRPGCHLHGHPLVLGLAVGGLPGRPVERPGRRHGQVGVRGWRGDRPAQRSAPAELADLGLTGARCAGQAARVPGGHRRPAQPRDAGSPGPGVLLWRGGVFQPRWARATRHVDAG